MQENILRRNRGERGQTIILVAVSVVSLLAMAALAVDVVTLYVAKGEIQHAADAALPKLDLELLVDYAARMGDKSLASRLCCERPFTSGRGLASVRIDPLRAWGTLGGDTSRCTR